MDCPNVITLALGLRLKKRLTRLWAKKKLRNEGKCEGVNLHTPKGACTLRVWSPSGFPNFQRVFCLQGSKPNGLKSSLYHWKVIET